jgi:hypothetical protein
MPLNDTTIHQLQEIERTARVFVNEVEGNTELNELVESDHQGSLDALKKALADNRSVKDSAMEDFHAQRKGAMDNSAHTHAGPSGETLVVRDGTPVPGETPLISDSSAPHA